MQTPTHRIPETSGKAAWQRSAKQVEILYRLRSLVLTATMRRNADVPVPTEWEHWAEDLRRGRMHVAGSLIRFFDTLNRRMGYEGRMIADEALELIRQYKDVSFPDEPKAQSAVTPITSGETRRRSRGIQWNRTTETHKAVG